ncbi:MAG: glycosyl transferase group 1 [Actinotalea sp.]|nr:glycosyl transferase group 1 [Actinotalea sp.]
MQVAVVSTKRTVSLARLTTRLASAVGIGGTVLDLDRAYRPVGDETVLHPAELGISELELHRRAVLMDHDQLVRSMYPALLRETLTSAPGSFSLAVRPGILLLRRPDALEHSPEALVVVARTAGPPPRDDRQPDAAALALGSAYGPLVGLRGAKEEVLTHWERLVGAGSSLGSRWLDGLTAAFPHTTVRDPAFLVSASSLRVDHRVTADDARGTSLSLDGRPVTALDLSAFDPDVPWLLDAHMPGDPRGRLSEHPALASAVAAIAVELQHDLAGSSDVVPGQWDPETTSLRTTVEPVLRALYRSLSAEELARAPDPFEDGDAGELLEWLTETTADGGPGRYLRALRAGRDDLQRAFPHVPGGDTPAFLDWVRAHGAPEGYPSAILDAALARAPQVRRTAHGRPPAGMNVIGYLRGELGIGESARLMIAALAAAGVPHRAVAVDRHLISRQHAPESGTASGAPEVFDTSLICVNADLTAAVTASVPAVVARSYRIGMWYWEVEDFPATQHGAFAEVDEVWVATEFVRAAIEPHAPVPVVTMTPPLPQRGPGPTLTRADLGLPDGPLFLFSFDYLSTAERKNPLGLLDAFTSAFRPGEGPVLVIKSINADRRPSQAERLRLRAATRPDVILLEDYLDADARDALVARCDCYVSLHRSEGLGLTIAEAMAWGRPVIATAYSGNVDFMTEENSYLVPWTPTAIPSGAEPYPAGGTWADPDLTAAAAMMRAVVDDPADAARRGARAAQDIATFHSPTVVGARIAARLEETASRRRARSGLTVAARLREAARGARTSLR